MTTGDVDNQVGSSLASDVQIPKPELVSNRRLPLAYRFIKRVLDFLFATGGLLLLSPVILLLAVLLVLRRARIRSIPRVGLYGRQFRQTLIVSAPSQGAGRSFKAPGQRLAPLLWHVLMGDLSFVGPRPTGAQDRVFREIDLHERCALPPGLVCLHWLRSQANIDYSTEAESDAEYLARASLRADFGILLRAAPALLFGGKAEIAAANRISILGIPLDNLTMDEATAEILRRLDQMPPTQVCFVNADCANIAMRRPDYLEVLRGAGLSFADGIGLKIAGKILRRPIRQNVNGTDMFPRLCQALSGAEAGLFLLGGRPGVAEDVGRWIAANHPNTRVSGFRSGYFTADEEAEVVAQIKTSGARLLLVAMGAPRQELWIARHLDDLGVGVAIGVGGLFDFYAGRIPRAPVWMREIGLEWLFRFWQEPRRLAARYFLGNPLFVYRVLRERRGAGEARG